MKKLLLLVMVSLALSGCIAVPAYDGGYYHSTYPYYYYPRYYGPYPYWCPDVTFSLDSTASTVPTAGTISDAKVQDCASRLTTPRE